MQSLLKAAGIDDFSPMVDIYMPTSLRTMRVLSGIVNLINYLDDYAYPQHQEFTKDVSGLYQENMILVEQNEKLSLEYQKLAQKAEMEKPEVTQLLHQSEALTQQIYQLNTHQAKLQLETDKLKNSLRNEKTEVNLKKEDLQKRKINLDLIKSKVISSPEDLPRLQSELVQNIEDTTQETQYLQKKINQITEKILQLQKSLVPLRSLRELLELNQQKNKDLTTEKSQLEKLDYQKQELNQKAHYLLENYESKLKKKEYLLLSLKTLESTSQTQIHELQHELLRLQYETKKIEQQDRLATLRKTQEEAHLKFLQERKKRALETYNSFILTLNQLQNEILKELKAHSLNYI